MSDTKQRKLLSWVFAACVVSAAPAIAQELDTSRLPRTSGAKQVYATPLSTIYNANEPVAAAADIVKGLLAAQGWKPYSDPFGQAANIPSQQITNFKKGGQAVTVFIRTTPPPSNATSVTYNAIPLANDLPFTDDATDIGFAPDRPHLQLRTARSVEATLAFFRKEMGARGWSLWLRKEEAKQTGGPDGEIHDKTAHAYYVQDGKRPMLLTLQRDNDNLRVELKAIPPSLLVAERQKPEPATPPRRPEAATAADNTADELSKEIERAVRGAIGDALKPQPRPQQPAAAPQAPAQTLRSIAGSPAPIPMPEGALDLEFDGVRGSLGFSSAASVPSVAAFYREQMRAQGWQERTTPINRPNMVSLDFRKDGRQVSLTVMQMGTKVNVSGTGSGLVVAAKPATPERAAAVATPSIPQSLEADEMGGLPVPKSSTSKGTERTPFRTVLSANVSASVPSVLAFYRAELGKRNWTEEKRGASEREDAARIAFTSPDGPAVLTLSRKGGDTVVALSLRKPAAAEKAGVLPAPGQGKVLFGNMLDKEASVTVGKQTVKVGAGVGSKNPDGPKIDLPPGKHRFSIRIAGMPSQSEEVEIAAGETWGLLIGPGGVLPLQAY